MQDPRSPRKMAAPTTRTVFGTMWPSQRAAPQVQSTDTNCTWTALYSRPTLPDQLRLREIALMLQARIRFGSGGIQLRQLTISRVTLMRCEFGIRKNRRQVLRHTGTRK